MSGAGAAELNRVAAKQIRRDARALIADAQQALAAPATAAAAVTRAADALHDELVLASLQRKPITDLRKVTNTSMRLTALTNAGFASVASVLSVHPGHLLNVPGVGEQTAYAVHAAAREVAAQVHAATPPRIHPDRRTAASTSLLLALYRAQQVNEALLPHQDAAQRLTSELPALIGQAKPTRSALGWMIAGKPKKQAALAAASQLQAWNEWAVTSGARDAFGRTGAALNLAPAPDWLWADYLARTAHYLTVLDNADPEAAIATQRQPLPPDLMARVNAVQLDLRHLRGVNLRGYQAFGAKYAIAQGRVMIGDEMGLGKTMQALAVMAHLRATGATRFLVVCPASVIINWQREITRYTTIAAHRLHGPEAPTAMTQWHRSGGIAVTSFDTLKALPQATTPDLVVVDEAHYIKNSQTGRAQAANGWLAAAPRAILLSGTPMENRVSEFTALVHHLDPTVARRLDRHALAAGPEPFRRAAAPVYLRRNQDQVLTELPDLISVEEWENLEGGDLHAYRQAVAEGNFMAMRRAAYMTARPQDSAKMRRLLELVTEAHDNNRKVIVFSFFREVLDRAAAALPTGSYTGPLSGATPVGKRQELVDALDTPNGPTVLLAQIQAGGTGLNIQAASVIILCEPQIKPSLEDQAIARAHRMGQARTVQVHRLLNPTSVDQRVMALLADKRQEFDRYARTSAMAAKSPDATDAEITRFAATVVDEERRRLGIAA